MENIEILKMQDKLFSGVKNVLTESKGNLTCKNEKVIQKIIRKVVRRMDRNEKAVEKKEY